MPRARICPRIFRRTRRYRKVNPADSPILVLGLQSDIYDVPELYDEASTVIAAAHLADLRRGRGAGRRRVAACGAH